MCGILVTDSEDYDDFFVKRRGQDYKGVVYEHGIYFIHYLLSITGEFTSQPYQDGNIIMLYNGEIYNHTYTKSDGENIIPLYKKHGKDFVKHLDGEFAIALYDFDKQQVLFATDCFGTKPLWVNDIFCCSYESGVNGEKLKPNTVRVVDLKTRQYKEYNHTDFEFNNQHKDSYNDWIKAFKEAVKKRAKDDCFVGLSSGYDSGAIVNELNKLDISFKTFTVIGEEDKEVLDKRLSQVKNKEIIKVDKTKYLRYISTYVENFDYRMKVNGKIKQQTLHSDKASIGFAAICDKATKEGRKIHLSGQGADEIMSDYSPYPSQSELKGKFPKQLKEWFNFRDGGMYSYLGKEEYVGGSFNIESRYPFLDKQVVQEFLWLTPELKNQYYKAPLKVYFDKEEYPYKENHKMGFRLGD